MFDFCKLVVACGKNHTLVVTVEGKLYTCGSNDFGQLGHDGPRTRLRIYFSIHLNVNSCVICVLS